MDTHTLSKMLEKKWLEYAIKTVKHNGSVRKSDLVAAGAAYADCSMATSYRYLQGHNWTGGEFEEYRYFGQNMIRMRSK